MGGRLVQEEAPGVALMPGGCEPFNPACNLLTLAAKVPSQRTLAPACSLMALAVKVPAQRAPALILDSARAARARLCSFLTKQVGQRSRLMDVAGKAQPLAPWPRVHR